MLGSGWGGLWVEASCLGNGIGDHPCKMQVLQHCRRTQRTQYPLIKEYTLKYTLKYTLNYNIRGLYNLRVYSLTKGYLGSLGTCFDLGSWRLNPKP